MRCRRHVRGIVGDSEAVHGKKSDEIKEQLMEDVLSNRDLVRNMIQQSASGIGWLKASRAIRAGEPCARFFETWARHGCPAVARDKKEMDCLRVVGERFCEGTYTLTMAGRATEVDAREAVEQVLSRMHQSPSTALTFILVQRTVLNIECNQAGSNRLTVTRDGWRSRGATCAPSDEQIAALVRHLMTAAQGTTVRLPCDPSTSAFGHVVVSRPIEVHLVERRRVVLSATRSIRP